MQTKSLVFNRLFVIVATMSIDIYSAATLNIYGVDYHCIIVEISKNEAINIFKISDLSKKTGSI